MTATKEQLEKLVKQAVAVLQRHAPSDGLTDGQAIDLMYGIFDGPECRELLEQMSSGKRRGAYLNSPS